MKKLYEIKNLDKEVVDLLDENRKEDDLLRKRKSRHVELPFDETWMIDPNEESFEGKSYRKEIVQRVKVVLKRCPLTREEKQIIKKYYYEDKSIKDIAKELNRSIPYIYKKRTQIIKKLKEEYRLSFPFEYKEEVM